MNRAKPIKTLLYTTFLGLAAFVVWILFVDTDDTTGPSTPDEQAPVVMDDRELEDRVQLPTVSEQTPEQTPEQSHTPRAADVAQRRRFLAAEEALKSGDEESFAALAEGLRDYPLHPYLEHARLRRGINAADAETVSAFLERYRDTPLAPRLRDRWLDRLAAEGRWEDYVRFQVPATTAAWRCRSLRALIEVGREQEAFAAVTPLWLTGSSQSKECDPVFTAWQRAGGLTPSLVWERIALAMDDNNPGLAGYLKRLLPAGQGHRVDNWLAIHKEPARVVDRIGDPIGDPDGDPNGLLMLNHGVTRLARIDADAAADAWQQIQRRYAVPAALRERTSRRLGLRLLSSDQARGLALLGSIPATRENLDLQDRRLRAALEQQAWDSVAAWIAAMPDGEHKRDHWLYWQARAEEALGHATLAIELYRRAAGSLSLWGLMAADRIGAPYSFGHLTTPADPARIQRIEDSAALARIGELRALGRTVDMRREWRELTADREPADLLAAAVVAQRLGWHDQAIFTLARADYWDDLKLRFPVAHRTVIVQQSVETHLDPAWIIAIARQESAFAPDVVSHADAIGLMQLLPATARQTATRIGLPRPSRRDLTDPRLNIKLGAAYLAQLSARFDGHPALATAAYNAGPHRVDKWLPPAPMATDLWIATIPFHETRGYVRRVLAYRAIYAARLGQPRRIMDTLSNLVAPPPADPEPPAPPQTAAR